jgi:hypothetical protein
MESLNVETDYQSMPSPPPEMFYSIVESQGEILSPPVSPPLSPPVRPYQEDIHRIHSRLDQILLEIREIKEHIEKMDSPSSCTIL